MRMCHRDLLSGKRDLSSGKRDLLSGKRDLLSGKRDLLSGKRDLLYCKTDLLLYGKRDLLTLAYRTSTEAPRERRSWTRCTMVSGSASIPLIAQWSMVSLLELTAVMLCRV